MSVNGSQISRVWGPIVEREKIKALVPPGQQRNCPAVFVLDRDTGGIVWHVGTPKLPWMFVVAENKYMG